MYPYAFRIHNRTVLRVEAYISKLQCGAYVGAVEEMMCVVCVDVAEVA